MLVVRCCDPSCKVENPARGMPKHPIHVPTMGNIRNIGNIVQTAVGEYYVHINFHFLSIWVMIQLGNK